MGLRTESPAIGKEQQDASSLIYPISFILRSPTSSIVAEVINYHYRGACLRVGNEAREFFNPSRHRDVSLDFYLGVKCIKQDIPYRVLWESIASDGLVGIEFEISANTFIRRAERFVTNPHLPPTLSAQDPLDANRLVFCRVLNISTSGMLLSTSLVNKHLFPGMTLRHCHITFPGQAPIEVELSIANTKPSQKKGRFLIGAALAHECPEYESLMRNYLSMLSPVEAKDERMETLAEGKLLGRRLKAGLTFQVASDARAYEKVLKLRFAGYAAHGKVKSGTTWKDQGEGLEKEGTIFCGYLGGQLVASMEIRFGDGKLPLRLLTTAGVETLPGFDLKRTLEVNKLVVHPKAQGASDIVLGLVQKAHAVMLARGGFEVLLAATDKMVPFYERIGAEALDISFPHPSIQGTSLHLMAVRRETFIGAKHINPYNWLCVYEASQKHMEGIGFSPKTSFTPWQRLVAKATEKASHWKRGKRVRKTHHSLAATTSTLKVDPDPTGIPDKWRAHHLTAAWFRPTLMEAEAMVGRDRVEGILSRLEVPRDYFTERRAWVSIPFIDAFLEDFSHLGDVSDLLRRGGERALYPEAVGYRYHLLKHVLSPEQLLRAYAKRLPLSNPTRTVRLEEIAEGKARLSLGLAPGQPLPKHREICLHYQSHFAAALRIATGQEGKVKKIECLFHGDSACSYELTWIPVKKPLPRALKVSATLTVLAGVFTVGYPLLTPGFALLATGSAAVFLGSIVLAEALTRLGRYHRSLKGEFERAGEDSREKYAELQAANSELERRLNEQKLLDRSGREILRTGDVSRALRATLDGACEVFHFDRAILMLADEKRAWLRTAAVAGITEGLHEVWQFQVAITKSRDNPLVISSVYHGGSPVIITDIESHLFQLNDNSRALIQKLRSKGFIMVPLPAADGCWGVLIGDKSVSGKPLLPPDIGVLKTLGQHLGIALDGLSRLGQEATLRKLFEKHASTAVTATAEATLVAQDRNVVGMLLEIRDFTELMESIPPHAVLTVLHRISVLASKHIVSQRGLVERVMGESIFATWGAASPEGNSALAFTAARGILAEVEPLNQELARQGLPAVQLGIAIHQERSVVGNLDVCGEIVCIGPLTKMTASLAELAVQMHSPIIVSEAAIAAVPPELREGLTYLDWAGAPLNRPPMRVAVAPGQPSADTGSKRYSTATA